MVKSLRRNVTDIPISYSLGYSWCSGSVLSAVIGLQVLTGVILSFVYVALPNDAFFYVLGNTIDSFFYWVCRYLHIWGVSLIFVLLFIHLGRSLYYSSYSKLAVWNIGFVLYLVLMIESFVGYVLPWHQMSYWAATVLTTIVQGLPVIGSSVYSYVVGGFSVTGVTLIRLFSVHVCLGFLVIGGIVFHVMCLHMSGSNNPLYILPGYSDVVIFHPHYTSKDIFSLAVILFIGLVGVWSIPDLVVDPDGYVEANPLATPSTIKPEWYFLGYYAIIRAIESKIGGLGLVTSILLILWVPTNNNCCSYSLSRQFLFWVVCNAFLGLIFLGLCHPEIPYLVVCKVYGVSLVVGLFCFKLLWMQVVPSSNGLEW
uniref:Cytochrome b n=1 Tax=Caryophyllaeus brachycollis TaxID=1157996 RepID=A0A342K6D7_9CEST|nr:cytochrome b [Caryophyllaeus brachycollis]AMA34312.1 cytochrome b [Caryophyllaeus brachycollis]